MTGSVKAAVRAAVRALIVGSVGVAEVGAEVSVNEWVIVCPTCQVETDGYTTHAEAGYLAGIHNDLHHGSRPDAGTVPVLEPEDSPTKQVELDHSAGGGAG